MWVVIAGILLIALEIITGNFFILWYGIGLALVGAIGWALGFESAQAILWQTAIGFVIGHILLVLLRKKFIFKRAVEPRDEFLLEEGEGIIKEGELVEFRGTLWRYEASDQEFAIGERVKVEPLANNKVGVRKLPK